MTEREALKLARQLLWRYRHETPMGDQPHMICQEVDEAFERIDEALAQPEQEPVRREQKMFMEEQEFYATPQQRTWVGLTDEQIWDTPDYEETRKMYRFARAIEAKLKEKNT